MSATTKIEWTDATWNPVRGCTPVSPGCRFCYAARDAARKNSNPKLPSYHGFAQFVKIGGHAVAQWTGIVEALPGQYQPLRWKEPRRIFVNSMSDLWHEKLEPSDIAKIYGTMFLCPHHTFQVLTKRPEIRRRWFNHPEFWQEVYYAAYATAIDVFGTPPADDWPRSRLPAWIWEGTSVESPAEKFRIDILRETPAPVRFLSVEPLLADIGLLDLRGISWVIVGGESGPSARPCHLDWIRSIVAQCRWMSVPCFVKQAGSNSDLAEHSKFVCTHSRGGDPGEWPEDLRVREFPAVPVG